MKETSAHVTGTYDLVLIYLHRINDFRVMSIQFQLFLLFMLVWLAEGNICLVGRAKYLYLV